MIYERVTKYYSLTLFQQIIHTNYHKRSEFDIKNSNGMNKHFESTAYLINDFRWRKEPQHKFEKKISYRCEIQIKMFNDNHR